MTALERLIANCNSIIAFLSTFSASTAQDVSFEFINEDDTTEIITFSNIKKFQESVNVFRDESGAFVDKDGSRINVNADTLNGKTASEIGTSSALKFKMLLDTTAGCFSERWMWGVTDNNELIHWGRSVYGLSGDVGSTDNNAGYSVIHQPSSKKDVLIKAIYATTWTGYVLYEDGDLYGIGYSVYGQMGQGNTVNQSDLVHILFDVESFASSSHGYHQDYNTQIAIKTDGSVWTWGCNSYGQCGNGTTTNQLSPGERSIPALYDGERIVKAYVCDTHVTSTYLLSDQGRVFSAGWNGDGGALGLGDATNRNEFSLVSGTLANEFVTSLSVAGGTRSSTTAYYRHSVVALTDSGDLFGWGYGGEGDLGLGSTTSYDLPQKITIGDADSAIVKIADSFGGWTCRFAIADSGDLWGWGHNSYGCLGAGSEAVQSSPFKVVLINEDGTENTSGVKDVLIISSGTYGYHHTSFVFTNDGKIFSAGYGGEGQLGRNQTANDSIFTEIRFAHSADIKQMSFGGHSSAVTVYALLNDGRIAAWGDNASRQAVINRTDESVCVPQFTIQ